MNKTFFIFSALLIFTLLTLSCATDPGDEALCPECDNKTELLVGNKCVPIDEIEECSPDGHAHGDECHCFSGQEPSEIGEKQYCLQQGCKEAETECSGHGHLENGECHCDEGFKQDHDDKTICIPDSEEHDVDYEACEAVENIGENVTAADVFEKFDEAHVDLVVGAEITLPEQKEGFVHFPVEHTGEFAIYIDREDVVESVYDSERNELSIENAGSNGDCSDKLKEILHISATNESGTKTPVIIKFKAKGGKVKIFIHKLETDHE